ncbi:MAG: type II toxin-antitoxin system death-on-curing family toxin [Bdellovibrionaceae bacterium]|nr:type II toxin-antitoxin system death-on-curing family toxin [Pseudobdellovibrionaceae bacterium]
MAPRFLSYEQVLRLHKGQIELFGGSHGVRDEGLLASALAQPESGFGGEYLHKDVFEMAAAYLFHLVQNHPFADGNKRIGALAAAVFLQVNGWRIIADEDDFEHLVLETAQHRKTKTEIAEFFRSNTGPEK